MLCPPNERIDVKRLLTTLLALAMSISIALPASIAQAAPIAMPMQVTATQPAYDDARSVVIIPDLTGITYTVDGSPVAPGEFTVTPAAPSGSSVTIVANRASDGMTWTWTHQFPYLLKATAPTFRASDSSIKTPSHWGVTYWLLRPDGTEQKLASNSYTLVPELKGLPFTVEARSNSNTRVLLQGTTAWAHTFDNVAEEPRWDDATSTIGIPDLAGISYTVDGAAVPAGDFPVTTAQGGTSVEVVAERASDGQIWTWTHHFPHVVTPAAPVFENSELRIKTPSLWGVTYWFIAPDGTEQAMPSNSYFLVDAYAGETVRVEARSNSARQTLLAGTTSWTHTFPARAAAPTFSKEHSTVTIPNVDGVEYRIGGELMAPGTHTYDTSNGAVTLIVTAVQTATGDESRWTGILPQLINPDAPDFDDAKHLIWAPSHMHVTYYAVVQETGEEIKMNSRSWNGSWEQFSGKTVTVEARENNAYVLLTGQKSWQHTFVDRPDYSLAHGDEFNGPGIAKDWNIYDGNKNLRSFMRQENMRVVKLDDGTSALEITTMRHCLANPDDPVSDENANPGGDPCPAGTTTAYSSGNMVSPYDIDVPKSIETRVRIDSPHKGITTAIWAHNDAPYCEWYPETPARNDTGELDLVELWSTTYAQFSTFAGCWNDERGVPKYSASKPKIDVDLPGKWHTYRVDYDGRAITYTVDGVPAKSSEGTEVTAEAYRYDSRYADNTVDQEKMDRVMQDYDWRLSAGAKVPVIGGWAPYVRDDEPFPVQRDLVDYIRVEQWDSSALPTIAASGDQTTSVDGIAEISGTTSLPGAQVRAEVRVGDVEWSVSSSTTAAADGSFSLPLTYGAGNAGSFQYRVSVTSPDGFWASDAFKLHRQSSVSIATAGVRPVGAATNAWGSTGVPNAEVFTEVQLSDGSWSRSQTSTTNASGGYVLPLTYGVNAVGSYTFRVGVVDGGKTIYSAPAALERIPSIASAGHREIGIQSSAWGSTGVPGAKVFTQVKLADGTWSQSRVGTTNAAGGYTLPLTYGMNQAGVYEYRIGLETGGNTVYSDVIEFQRIPTVASAGTKRINESTFAWGATGHAGIRVSTQVRLPDGSWSTSRTGTTDANGSYVLPLTYGSDVVGTQHYRVVASTPTGQVASKEFTLTRTR